MKVGDMVTINEEDAYFCKGQAVIVFDVIDDHEIIVTVGFARKRIYKCKVTKFDFE